MKKVTLWGFIISDFPFLGNLSHAIVELFNIVCAQFITTNCGIFLKRWEYQTTWPASWEICMQVKKQQLELDMEQQTGSKSGKEYVKAVYCHPTYLTYIQSTSWEMLAGWSISWNQNFQEKFQ